MAIPPLYWSAVRTESTNRYSPAPVTRTRIPSAGPPFRMTSIPISVPFPSLVTVEDSVTQLLVQKQTAPGRDPGGGSWGRSVLSVSLVDRPNIVRPRHRGGPSHAVAPACIDKHPVSQTRLVHVHPEGHGSDGLIPVVPEECARLPERVMQANGLAARGQVIAVLGKGLAVVADLAVDIDATGRAEADQLSHREHPFRVNRGTYPLLADTVP